MVFREYNIVLSCFVNSLDGNLIGDKGGVALGEALKVNMTLQILRRV